MFNSSHIFGRVRAFTLIELLAVIVISGVLVSLVGAGIQSVRSSAMSAAEVAAGRILITALHQATADSDGVLPGGYDRTVQRVDLPDGSSVHGPAASRYPYRLAPYFDFNMKGTILVGRNTRQVAVDDAYSVSVTPSLGINYLFVGGDRLANGNYVLPVSETITRSAQSTNVIVFASAGTGKSPDLQHGYAILTPPQVYGPTWSSGEWKPDSSPSSFGNVHPRHRDRAVCIFLDGSSRLLSIEELRDMRLWSPIAKDTNNEAYTVTAATPSRRR